MTRCILHVDMDAFFASVEQARRPDLRGKPVVVGGQPGQRGVVASASYEARRYGLHSAMPTSTAYRLCPQAVFLPADFSLYGARSGRLREMFRALTPLVQPMGLDEAYLDLTGFEALYGPPQQVARALKERIQSELGVTASVGIASNKLVAKVASDREKPDGLVEVAPGREAAFLAPLPVQALPGVGSATTLALQRLGINRVGQLAQTPFPVLRSRFGSLAPRLLEMAQGQDSSAVHLPGAAKSISRSTTFSQDTLDLSYVSAILAHLSERVGARLREKGRAARTIHLTLRFADFETITRSATLRQPTDSDQVLFSLASRLLIQSLSGKKLRLVGVGVTGLTERALQPSLFEPPRAGVGLDRCLDAIRDRHGLGAIQRGRTLSLGREYPMEKRDYLLPASLLQHERLPLYVARPKCLRITRLCHLPVGS